MGKWTSTELNDVKLLMIWKYYLQVSKMDPSECNITLLLRLVKTLVSIASEPSSDQFRIYCNQDSQLHILRDSHLLACYKYGKSEILKIEKGTCPKLEVATIQ